MPCIDLCFRVMVMVTLMLVFLFFNLKSVYLACLLSIDCNDDCLFILIFIINAFL